MRFQLPADCAGISYAGRQLAVAGDGTVEAAPAAAGDLAVHGLVPVADRPADGADDDVKSGRRGR